MLHRQLQWNYIEFIVVCTVRNYDRTYQGTIWKKGITFLNYDKFLFYDPGLHTHQIYSLQTTEKIHNMMREINTSRFLYEREITSYTKQRLHTKIFTKKTQDPLLNEEELLSSRVEVYSPLHSLSYLWSLST